MRNVRCYLLLPALACLVSLSGCGVLPIYPRGGSKNRALIAYWPAPEGSTKLKLAVKDNIDMAGLVTSAGSEFFARSRPPAEFDAPLLAIARKRDVHFVGKANLSEFAVSPSGINEYFGTPKNPFSGWRQLIPGGSSCGSAVAVASGLADVAFGTDTAGFRAGAGGVLRGRRFEDHVWPRADRGSPSDRG